MSDQPEQLSNAGLLRLPYTIMTALGPMTIEFTDAERDKFIDHKRKNIPMQWSLGWLFTDAMIALLKGHPQSLPPPGSVPGLSPGGIALPNQGIFVPGQ